MKKKTFSLFETLFFCIISAIIVGFSCSVIMYRHYDQKTVQYDFASVTSDEYLSEFLSKYEEIINNYYDDINKEELIDAALAAMLNYLGDPYTTYLNEDAAANLLQELSGEYTGVGIEITVDESSSVIINKVFDNTPASVSGLKAGDVILSVNDKLIDESNMSELTNEIKLGENDTSVLAISRNGVKYVFNVTRTSINIPSVFTEILDNNVGYMKISVFSNTTANQVKSGLKDLIDKNISKLIIDLRNNSGGYLTSAQSIIEQFLEKNEIMYSIQSKTGTEEFKDSTDESLDLKIVVLVNGASASASEILAGALRDSYGASLVGVTTYGKGKVQQTSATDSGGLIKYTSAKWLIPSGTCIDGIGLIPEYIEELSEKYIESPIRENDNQLIKALEIINK